MPDLTETIFTPSGERRPSDKRHSLIARAMWTELVDARELCWRLFLRDLSAKYRQSALGLVWAVLLPVVTLVMFIGMQASGLLRTQGLTTPYPVYAVLGLTWWGLFAGGLGAASSSLVQASNMMRRLRFPRVALVVASSGQALVDLAVRLVVASVVLGIYGIRPSLGGLGLALLCLVPLYLLTLGLSFMVSLLGVVLRDTAQLVHWALLGLMLLTPVLYPIPSGTFLGRVNGWNPLHYLIAVPRDLVLTGECRATGALVASILVAIAVFGVGWRVFFLAQTRIAERL
jgi:lipopolysaccharide transport system permease protein